MFAPRLTLARTLILTFILAIGATPLLSADFNPRFERPTEFRQTIEFGMLFIEGKFVPGPYELVADQSTFTVNGVSIPTDESSNDDQSEQRRRRVWGPQRPTSMRAANRFSEALSSDNIIVLFNDQPERIIIEPVNQVAFLQAFQGEATPQIRDEFIALAPVEASQPTWASWLSNTPHSAALLEQSQQRLAMFEKQKSATSNLLAASARLEQFSYPLTIAAMLLSVVAFGHLMHWTRLGFHESGENTAETSKFVGVALLLMGGMSLIDLAWTTLSSQAGQMTELNPIAELFIGSPVQLGLFKVAATLVAFAIFYFFRQRRRIQQATWWMCLVCVLLTFRWIMIDSVVNM